MTYLLYKEGLIRNNAGHIASVKHKSNPVKIIQHCYLHCCLNTIKRCHSSIVNSHHLKWAWHMVKGHILSYKECMLTLRVNFDPDGMVESRPRVSIVPVVSWIRNGMLTPEEGSSEYMICVGCLSVWGCGVCEDVGECGVWIVWEYGCACVKVVSVWVCECVRVGSACVTVWTYISSGGSKVTILSFNHEYRGSSWGSVTNLCNYKRKNYNNYT